MSAWLFDLGNTRLKCAPLVSGAAGAVLALPHRASDLASGLAAALPDRLEVAYVASVANDRLRVALLEALAQRCRRICLVRTQPGFGDLRIAYADPRRLGVDRFLAMLGTRTRFHEAVLLAGVGTALTLDLIDAQGRHVGGRIAPSPDLMREALHERASQLPARGGAYTEFATDTEDALASGCTGAAVALIEHGLHAAEMRLGSRPRLVLHGGGAPELAQHLPDATVLAAPVLDGLARWASVASPE